MINKNWKVALKISYPVAFIPRNKAAFSNKEGRIKYTQKTPYINCEIVMML